MALATGKRAPAGAYLTFDDEKGRRRSLTATGQSEANARKPEGKITQDRVKKEQGTNLKVPQYDKSESGASSASSRKRAKNSKLDLKPGDTPTRYLKQKDIWKKLSKCLAEVCQRRPADPFEFIAHWLYKSVDSEIYFYEKIQFTKECETLLWEYAKSKEKKQEMIMKINEKMKELKNGITDAKLKQSVLINATFSEARLKTKPWDYGQASDITGMQKALLKIQQEQSSGMRTLKPPDLAASDSSDDDMQAFTARLGLKKNIPIMISMTIDSGSDKDSSDSEETLQVGLRAGPRRGASPRRMSMQMTEFEKQLHVKQAEMAIRERKPKGTDLFKKKAKALSQGIAQTKKKAEPQKQSKPGGIQIKQQKLESRDASRKNSTSEYVDYYKESPSSVGSSVLRDPSLSPWTAYDAPSPAPPPSLPYPLHSSSSDSSDPVDSSEYETPTTSGSAESTDSSSHADGIPLHSTYLIDPMENISSLHIAASEFQAVSNVQIAVERKASEQDAWMGELKKSRNAIKHTSTIIPTLKKPVTTKQLNNEIDKELEKEEKQAEKRKIKASKEYTKELSAQKNALAYLLRSDVREIELVQRAIQLAKQFNANIDDIQSNILRKQRQMEQNKMEIISLEKRIAVSTHGKAGEKIVQQLKDQLKKLRQKKDEIRLTIESFNRDLQRAKNEGKSLQESIRNQLDQRKVKTEMELDKKRSTLKRTISDNVFMTNELEEIEMKHAASSQSQGPYSGYSGDMGDTGDTFLMREVSEELNEGLTRSNDDITALVQDIQEQSERVNRLDRAVERHRSSISNIEEFERIDIGPLLKEETNRISSIMETKAAIKENKDETVRQNSLQKHKHSKAPKKSKLSQDRNLQTGEPTTRRGSTYRETTEPTSRRGSSSRETTETTSRRGSTSRATTEPTSWRGSTSRETTEPTSRRGSTRYIKSPRQETEDVRAPIAHIQGRLNSAINQVDRDYAQSQALRDRLDEEQLELQQMRAKAVMLKYKIEEATNEEEKDRLRKLSAWTEQSIENHETRLKEMRKGLKTLGALTGETLLSMTMDIAVAEVEIAELKEDLESLRVIIGGDIAERYATIKSITRKLVDKEAALEKIKGKKKVENDNAGIIMKAKKTVLRKEEQHKMTGINDLSKMFLKYRTEIQEEEADLNDIDDELRHIKNTAKKLKDKVQLKQLERKYQTLTQRKETLQKTIKSKQKASVDLKSQLASLSAEKIAIRASIIAYNVTLEKDEQDEQDVPDDIAVSPMGKDPAMVAKEKRKLKLLTTKSVINDIDKEFSRQAKSAEMIDDVKDMKAENDDDDNTQLVEGKLADDDTPLVKGKKAGKTGRFKKHGTEVRKFSVTTDVFKEGSEKSKSSKADKVLRDIALSVAGSSDLLEDLDDDELIEAAQAVVSSENMESLSRLDNAVDKIEGTLRPKQSRHKKAPKVQAGESMPTIQPKKKKIGQKKRAAHSNESLDHVDSTDDVVHNLDDLLQMEEEDGMDEEDMGEEATEEDKQAAEQRKAERQADRAAKIAKAKRRQAAAKQRQAKKQQIHSSTHSDDGSGEDHATEGVEENTEIEDESVTISGALTSFGEDPFGGDSSGFPFDYHHDEEEDADPPFFSGEPSSPHFDNECEWTLEADTMTLVCVHPLLGTIKARRYRSSQMLDNPRYWAQKDFDLSVFYHGEIYNNAAWAADDAIPGAARGNDPHKPSSNLSLKRKK